MFCPKCGFDMGDNNTCEKCGFVVANEEEKTDVLEDVSVDIDETENVETEVEDEIGATEEDLVVDFNQIDENAAKSTKKSSGTWLVALVSFVAGALAALIVMSCINGTFMSFFDKTVNGNPGAVVESFLKDQLETQNAKSLTNECSVYYRNSVIEQLKQYQAYGNQIDVDLDMDISKDSNFEKVAKFWWQGDSSRKFKLLSFNATKIEYFKSGTSEYKDYLSTYKTSGVESVSKYAEKATMFAKVTFDMNYSIETIAQPTTAPETYTANTKKAKKGAKTTTTTTTTTTATQVTTKSTTSKSSYSGTMICVKENGNWRIFKEAETNN